MCSPPATRAFLFASALLLVAPALAPAQESKGTPAARAEIARGKTAMEAKDYAAARIAFARAVELEPAWPEAHSSYQIATGYVAGGRIAEEGTISREVAAKSTEMLRAQYEAWIKAHPTTAGYFWGLADVLPATDRAKAQDLCGKALSFDPAFAPAYATLAKIAGAGGDVKTQLDFLRKASEAAPDTPSYLRAYISALWPVDPGTARALSLRMAERFPSDPATAQVLFNLAAQSDDMSEKIAGLERLRRQPGTVLQSAMRLLYGLYAASDPEKAVALAQEMVAKTPAASARTWTDALERGKQVARVRSLITEKQFSAALAMADAAPQSPSGKVIPNLDASEPTVQEMTLLRAEAEAGLGRMDRAYARVMDVFVQQPGDRLHAVLARYGSALGKAPAGVDDDVRARLVANGTPAPDFPIDTYPDGRKGTLAALRGKVVLLNFWFPT